MPSPKDILDMLVIMAARPVQSCLISHVGAGSSEQCFTFSEEKEHTRSRSCKSATPHMACHSLLICLDFSKSMVPICRLFVTVVSVPPYIHAPPTPGDQQVIFCGSIDSSSCVNDGVIEVSIQIAIGSYQTFTCLTGANVSAINWRT